MVALTILQTHHQVDLSEITTIIMMMISHLLLLAAEEEEEEVVVVVVVEEESMMMVSTYHGFCIYCQGNLLTIFRHSQLIYFISFFTQTGKTTSLAPIGITMTIKATHPLALTCTMTMVTMTMDTMIGVTMDDMMMIIQVQIGMITVMMIGSTE